MKTSFKEFFKENQIYNGFENDAVAKYVFDSILSKDENIIAMIECNDAGEPALCGCIFEIEQYCTINNQSKFNLSNDFAKQALGRMVRSVLLPFGYESKSQKRIPNKYNSVYVKSAKTFSKIKPAVLRIEKKIVAI